MASSTPWDQEIWEEDEPLSSRQHSEYPYLSESQSSREYPYLSESQSSREYLCLSESQSSLEYTNVDESHSSRGYSEGHRNTYRENCNFDIVTGRKTEDFETEVIIEQGDIGKIIGKGGYKIREMEEISGAKIRIYSENTAEAPYVLISGPNLARDRGRELLENLIADIREAAKFKAVKQVQPPITTTQPAGDSFFETIDWDALKIDSDIARKKKLAALPKIKKDFYCEDREIAAWSSKEVDIFRIENNNIVVSKVEEKDRRPIPNPVKTFAQAFHNYPEILKEVLKQGFSTPSPIQCQSWPILLKGHDLIGIAQTGTGKTIAFLLPALIHIDNQLTPRKNRPGPTCLILAPTRELAQQIEQEAKKYNYRGIKCVCVYGGGNRREQINVVARGVEIVIATPGRLNDLIMNNIVDVTSVTYLVLDEADRMLDMGFEPQIKKILIDVRPDRQTVMTSATWPEGVRQLADRYMDKPFQVHIGSLDLAAVHSVTQTIVFADEEEKRDILYEFIENMLPDDKAIVFVDKKCVADDLTSDLILYGIECQSIHGDREQCDREQALDDLKTGRVRLLIATDVASRGLDIKDITHVFNMNMPRNVEDYVHRVGRTGRAGRTGTSITIITRQDWMQASKLIKILEESNQDVPAELYKMAERHKIWKGKKDAEDAACGFRRPRFSGGRNRY